MKINNQIKANQEISIHSVNQMKEIEEFENKVYSERLGKNVPLNFAEGFIQGQVSMRPFILKQFQKEIKELKKFIEYNVRFERDVDYHRLMEKIKNRFGDLE